MRLHALGTLFLNVLISKHFLQRADIRHFESPGLVTGGFLFSWLHAKPTKQASSCSHLVVHASLNEPNRSANRPFKFTLLFPRIRLIRHFISSARILSRSCFNLKPKNLIFIISVCTFFIPIEQKMILFGMLNFYLMKNKFFN